MALFRSYKHRGYGRRRRGPVPAIFATLVLGAGLWWFYPTPEGGSSPQVPDGAPKPILVTRRPEVPSADPITPDVPERGEPGHATKRRGGEVPLSATSEPQAQRAESLIAAGRRALESNDLLVARAHFSDALAGGAMEPERSLLQAELTRIGSETIFSSRVLPDDPLTFRYVIQPGDTLGKIAKANKISDELLADVNGIQNKNLIRAGQTIKVIRGPFHAVVESGAHTMGLYLEKTFVRQYRVGLGLDNGTPTGTWEVSTKLINPTYYPPRGGRIVSPDDPENPLGGRWVGLTGIAGEAVGQLRYGLHGTNEPDTIGQSVSLGCIRMFNEDVAQVYTYLIEKHSHVQVLP